MFRLFSSHCHQVITTELHPTDRSWLHSQLASAVHCKGIMKRMSFYLKRQTQADQQAARAAACFSPQRCLMAFVLLEPLTDEMSSGGVVLLLETNTPCTLLWGHRLHRFIVIGFTNSAVTCTINKKSLLHTDSKHWTLHTHIPLAIRIGQHTLLPTKVKCNFQYISNMILE